MIPETRSWAAFPGPFAYLTNMEKRTMKNLGKRVLISIVPAMIVIALGTVASGAIKLLKGQTIYIPSYSNVLGDYQPINLRANLVIHNTDPVHPITVVRIDNYDTNGNMVEKYLPKPVELKALAATRITIKNPKKGDEGAGANFIVQWKSENKVTEPLIECIMVGALGTQGHTFTSSGRIIAEEGD
ncbi:MAG: DUF3124 domain-containing protein [Deltaproteobacteria bacterium]|nr:MAG: DUF3124 domain-containing protein [Deltaproteobacteria bacterium]